MYQILQKFDIHWHDGGPSITMMYHLRRVSDLLCNWKSCLLCYMKDVLYCSIFFKWNKLVRVPVRVTHSVTDQWHWPVVYARSWSAWLTHVSSAILQNMAFWTKAFRKHCSTMDHLVSLEKYVWDAFARKQQQLVSSLICRKPTRLLGNMVSSVTYIGLESEADCLFLWVSHRLPNSSLRKDHNLTNFIQKKEYQLVVSWLLHALE